MLRPAIGMSGFEPPTTLQFMCKPVLPLNYIPWSAPAHKEPALDREMFCIIHAEMHPCGIEPPLQHHYCRMHPLERRVRIYRKLDNVISIRSHLWETVKNKNASKHDFSYLLALASMRLGSKNIFYKCDGGFAPTVCLITARILMAWFFNHNRICTDIRVAFPLQYCIPHILFSPFCFHVLNIHHYLILA